MRKTLASLLLAAFTAAAGAQSLPYGVSIDNLAAMRQADGSSVLTGNVANHGEKMVPRLAVTFVLYDAQGNEIGRTTGQRDTPLAPGETWQVRATTPHTFSRFSAKEIKAE